MAARACREHGMTTVEYGVGTVAVCTAALVLCGLGNDGFVLDELHDLFGHITDVVPFIDGFPGPLRNWLL